MTNAPVLSPGDTVARYQITRMIGSGSMGAVYECTHLDSNTRVALKVLHPFAAQSAENTARFVREGQAAARVQHPAVVGIYEAGMHADRFFLSMEYLEGSNLAQSLLRTGAMAPVQIADVLVPVMAGVMAAHAAGVIHRDLRPDNIFLARAPNGALMPKVLDFGVAKLGADTGAQPLTADASSLGMPQYMSPEQLRSAKAVDARTDQYALAVIAYECATGRVPFHGATAYEVFQAVTKGEFPRPSMSQPGFPPAFEAAILRAMSQQADMRFPGVAEFARELLPFASAPTRDAYQTAISASSATEFGLEQAIAQGQAAAAAAGRTVGQMIDAANAPTSMALEDMIAQGKAGTAGSGKTVGQMIEQAYAPTVGGLEHAIAEGIAAKRRAEGEAMNPVAPHPPPQPAAPARGKLVAAGAAGVVVVGALIVFALRLLAGH